MIACLPLVSLAALALAGCAATSPEPAPMPAAVNCPNGNTELPPAWTGWTAARPLAAAANVGGTATAHFTAGEAIDLTLRPDPEVVYVSLPQGEGEADSFGGLAAFRVERAGRYGVGVSAGVWIDITRDGKPSATALFGPGPACSPVRKVVAFDLVPGDYVLEISGSETPDVRLMVALGGVPTPRE
jgi:hypothetical protein